MIRILILVVVWILSIAFSVIWSYENPEKVELIKSYFKKKQTVEVKKVSSNIQKFTANSFNVEIEKVLDIIEKRFHPNNWNVYTFQCSDGDNWPDDTQKTTDSLERIKNFSQLVGYCEIDTAPVKDHTSWFAQSRLSNVYKPFADKKLKIAEINEKKDVWPAFNKFFGKRIIVGR